MVSTDIYTKLSCPQMFILFLKLNSLPTFLYIIWSGTSSPSLILYQEWLDVLRTAVILKFPSVQY